MSVSSRERQKKWRARQKDRKQVTVMLSGPAYSNLKRRAEATGQNFSRIIDEKLIGEPARVDYSMIKRGGPATDLMEHYRRVAEKFNAFSEEMTGLKHWLEKEIDARISVEKSLTKSEERFHLILENSYDVIFRANLNEDTYDYISPSSKRVYGYTPEEVKAMGYKKIRRLTHPDDHERFMEHFRKYTKKEPVGKDEVIEHRFKHKTLGYRWMSSVHTLVFDDAGRPVVLIGSTRDVHRRKQAEIELMKMHDELEKRVNERTRSLEEANTALRLMLRKEEEVKSALESSMTDNVNHMILPHIERLKTAHLSAREKECLETIESGLHDILSPALSRLLSKNPGLSRGEIPVATLVIQGKTTKEIAGLLGLSIKTVEFHRANIREKLGIRNRKVELRLHLLSL